MNENNKNRRLIKSIVNKKNDDDNDQAFIDVKIDEDGHLKSRTTTDLSYIYKNIRKSNSEPDFE